MADDKVTIAGEIESTAFGDNAVPWVGTFEDTDSNGDVDAFVVNQEGEIPSIGTSVLLVQINAVHEATEM
jgi:hypothetical protein